MNFLEHTALQLYNRHKDHLHQLAVVFPNRRQSVYFKYYFSRMVSPPVFLPQLFTIEELIQTSSGIYDADPLVQNMTLYQAYMEVCKENGEDASQGFEQFFPIAETLLKDFREIDTYLLKPGEIFSVLFNLEAIDKSFDHLSEEQRAFLKRFWTALKSKDKYQELFLKLWQRLPATYDKFHRQLDQQQLTTIGMMYRRLAKEATNINHYKSRWKHIAFVGFNALNKAEEEIIYQWQQAGFASLWLDADSYYLTDSAQEAGFFLRKNLNETGLVNELSLLNSIENYDHPAEIWPVAGDTMQAKLIAQWLQQIQKEEGTAAIILADEKLLVPVLQSIPGHAGPVNVTMGYPMQQSVLYSFFTLYFDIQNNLGNYQYRYLHHELVQQWLYHPLCDWTADDKTAFIARMQSNNQLRVDCEVLKKKSAITALMLSRQMNIADASKILRQTLELIHGEALRGNDQILQAACSAGWQALQTLHPILSVMKPAPSMHFIAQVVKRHFAGMNIALEGEPLKGVQVMGLLESRGLDFDHILLLGAAEGTLPRIHPPQSFLPDAVRRAFGLPVAEYQDAIFAYTFYRLLHRSKSMVMVYNSLVSEESTGEPSRFIKQLQFETKIPFTTYRTTTSLQPNPIHPITITKTSHILSCLSRYESPNAKIAFSASQLNTYLACRLQFFFKYIAGLEASKEISEQIDASQFGSLVHKLMEMLYADVQVKQGHGRITESSVEYMRSRVGALLEDAYDETVRKNNVQEPIPHSGLTQVVKKVAVQYANGFLDQDLAYAPFEIENLEVSFLQSFELSPGGRLVTLKGIIDRVDKKNGLFRMVDYKTGSDKIEFESIEKLFDRDGNKMNKAALQTLIYSWMFKKEFPDKSNFQPALVPLRALQKNAETRLYAKEGKVFVESQNVHGYLQEIEEHLCKLLEEIFDPAISFNQTEDLKTCTYCDFSGICRRN